MSDGRQRYKDLEEEAFANGDAERRLGHILI